MNKNQIHLCTTEVICQYETHKCIYEWSMAQGTFTKESKLYHVDTIIHKSKINHLLRIPIMQQSYWGYYMYGPRGG